MDRSELVRRIAAGERFGFLAFYGHRPPEDGSVDASCLSQWYHAPFVVDGVRYPTAEHYMMAEKARRFRDQGTLEAILATSHPGDAKALGRQVRGYDDTTWAEVRFDAVVRGNLAKFQQHPALGAFLVGTGERVLVEASPRDLVWGVGYGRDNLAIFEPERWRGQNLLGFALMRVREVIRG